MLKDLNAILALTAGLTLVSCSSDSTTTPPVDAGKDMNAMEAGCPATDAGCPAQDAGCPATDAGCMSKDAMADGPTDANTD